MMHETRSLTVAARRTGSRVTGIMFPICMVGLSATCVRAQEQPAPTAGADRDPSSVATFRFRIEETETGQPIPGRLTFRGTDGGDEAELFGNDMADPTHLAVRNNIVYTITGEGVMTVPHGRYVVYASRGIEWSIDATADEIEFRAGAEVEWTARLTHEVDTSGWISGDFHLHTLTYSGHGDANMNERIISIVGEGVEFAVATDHNHLTDYHPTMEHVGATDLLTSVTGNEVSTSIGHLNAFPLDPQDEPVNHRLTDANELFKLIRAQTSEFGIVPIIQLNHPRWSGIDYFARTGLDPVAGTTWHDNYSTDFDSLEVMNENEGWGMFEANVDGIETDANAHSVLQDWFNLLNRGYRYTAVGNSDSHTVHYDMAGYPRNFVMYPGDDTKPGDIEPALVTQAVRKRQVTTTTGPFLQYTVNGHSPGTDVVAGRDGIIDVRIDIQAASWVPCDRVRVIVNGDEAALFTMSDSESGDPRPVQRFDSTIRLSIEHDAWIAVIADSVTHTLDPIVGPQGRPVYPMAVANPIWIDAEGDGEWVSPWDRAVAKVAAATSLEQIMPTNRTDAVLTILAAAEAQSPLAPELVRAGLSSEHRRIVLAAARGAEALGDPALIDALEALWERRDALDAYTAVALLRALHACEPADSYSDRLTAWMLTDTGLASVRQFQSEVAPMMPGIPARDWMVLGYFANPISTTILTSDYGPEGEYARWKAGHALDPADEPYVSKINRPIEWQALRAEGAGGYLNLQQIDPNRAMYERSVAYARVWVKVSQDMSVPIAYGTDDGSQVFVNGQKIHEDTTQHGASPLDFIQIVPLNAGWNHVLFKVENGGGGYGMYFRVLSNDVEYSAVGPM